MIKNGAGRPRRAKHSARRLLFLIVTAALIGAAVWYVLNWYDDSGEPVPAARPTAVVSGKSVDETPVTKADVDNYKVPASHPRYISIPALGIERTRVQAVGLTKNSELDTPRNISDTAWYDKSAYPGQGDGAVLINGHNGGYSRDGVFARLGMLKDGDTIIIERGDGRQLTYRVVENRTEPLDEANKTGMSRIMTPYDPAKEGLGLITCTGNYVKSKKVFDKRVMVRAVMISGS